MMMLMMIMIINDDRKITIYESIYVLEDINT